MQPQKRMDIEKLFPHKKNCLYFNFSSDGPLPDTANEREIEKIIDIF